MLLWQDNFVSYTMQEEQRIRKEKIIERKRLMDQGDPLESLITMLAKGYVNDADLCEKIAVLYKVATPPPLRLHSGHSGMRPILTPICMRF
jgi:hypothetical protein